MNAAEPFNQWVLWNGDGTQDFICIEPMSGDVYKRQVQASKGFEKDVPLYYLLGDYDSDYDKYTDLEGAAEAMKEYPHEVYLMTIDTGYAA